MALFGKKRREAERLLADLRTELVELQQRLSAADAERAVIDARLSALGKLTASLQDQKPVIDPIMFESIDSLQQQVDTLQQLNGQVTQRLSDSDAAVRTTSEQLSGIQERLQSVSTELANQLSELGRDIDHLAEQQAALRESAPDAPATTLNDELIESLRSGQVRLANEQARYEIAFRADLAELAEQVRRQLADPTRRGR
jgi:chromosome segregation ATPase